jgi:hypothetical protein
MGRPKKPDRRDRQLNIRLNAGECSTIASRSVAFGMEPVDYARWVLLDNGRPSALPAPPESRFDRLAHVQLQRLGNLLNQLVRHTHQNGVLPVDDLVPLLRDIRALLSRGLP